MNYNFLIKYPFSKKAKEYLDKQNIDIFSIDDSILKKATLFILKTLNLNFSEQEKLFFENLNINDERVASTIIKIYPLSKIFVTVIDNIPLKQNFANFYKNQLIFYLKTSKNENELKELISDFFPALKKENNFYVSSLPEFLSLDLGNDYKLQYTNLEKGNIYFTQEDVIEILSLILKKEILKFQNISEDNLPPIFKKYITFIKKHLQQTNLNYVLKKVNFNKFPPCFSKLYLEITSGQQLSHLGNYHLAVFLNALHYSYEEILNIFSKANNFDEKIASYQIKNIIAKNYSVANCDTLKLNNLCVSNCEVKHPLQLLREEKEKEKDIKKE